MRYLNAFVLTGAALVFITLCGLVVGNRALSEPGMPVNQFAWLQYAAAAAVMLVNGWLSIRISQRGVEKKTEVAKDATDEDPGSQPQA